MVVIAVTGWLTAAADCSIFFYTFVHVMIIQGHFYEQQSNLNEQTFHIVESKKVYVQLLVFEFIQKILVQNVDFVII